MIQYSSGKSKTKASFWYPIAGIPEFSASGLPVQQQMLNKPAEILQLPATMPMSYGGQEFSMPNWAPVKAAQSIMGMYQPVQSGQRGSTSGWGAGISSLGLSGIGGTAASAGGAGSGGGGCCYMFLEGHNELESSVRRYRDSHFSPDSGVSRGYKRMSRWLVPLMKRYKLVKEVVKWVMLNPLAYIARWAEGKNKFGWIFVPFGIFWCDYWYLTAPRDKDYDICYNTNAL